MSFAVRVPDPRTAASTPSREGIGTRSSPMLAVAVPRPVIRW
jgi:hypothetical protein